MSNPTIMASEESHEFRILEGARALLAAAAGASYNYDVDGAFIVNQPQLKHLTEAANDAGVSDWPKALYYVHPGDAIFVVDTGCASRVTGDFMVTAGVRIGGPELPWQAGYVSMVAVQMRMLADIYRALNGQEIAGASIFVANRNLVLEVDGWALVQVQLSFEYSEPTAGEVV